MLGRVIYYRQRERESKYHIQGDVTKVLKDGWDLMIGHPPCTHLSVSGARWFKKKRKRQAKALEFFLTLLNCSIPHIALENPVSVVSSRIRKCDQIIHPWQFGHGETKTTCLWLKNLPRLKPTNVVEGRNDRVHRLFHTMRGHTLNDLRKERSRTYQGIADAMADQWGKCMNYFTGFGLNVKCQIMDR